MPVNLTLPLAAALALLHLYAGKLPIPNRPRWLSLSGGVAIAYVFGEILPSLADIQDAIGQLDPLAAHALGLLGLVTFHGVERSAIASRQARISAGAQDGSGDLAFWLHVASFATYNALFSLLLTRMGSPRDYLLLFVAVGLHYAGNDHRLREHHRQAYDRLGRWILAGAILLGWAVGESTGGPAGIMTTGSAALALVKAFLAGGVILNVLQGELPAASERSFAAFVTGAAAYTTVLWLM
jgi:hypothetical protein